jgi:ATP synthase protein I
VRDRRERHERNKREADQSFWANVGTMGMIGWSVALPAAAGALFGRWLDGVTGGGNVFVVFFMLVGIGIGCYVAWRQISERI